MTKQISPKYAPEVREHAVRMVFEHTGEHASQWAAISSIAAKIGCNPETLRGRQAERDQGKRPGLTTFRPGGARPPVQEMIAFIDGLRFHSDEARATEVTIAAQVLNRMLDRPNSVRVA